MSDNILKQFAEAIAARTIRVVDLSQPLGTVRVPHFACGRQLRLL
jgi:hypothetical protein